MSYEDDANKINEEGKDECGKKEKKNE